MMFALLVASAATTVPCLFLWAADHGQMRENRAAAAARADLPDSRSFA
jgi:hypothetical protein